MAFGWDRQNKTKVVSVSKIIIHIHSYDVVSWEIHINILLIPVILYCEVEVELMWGNNQSIISIDKRHSVIKIHIYYTNNNMEISWSVKST